MTIISKITKITLATVATIAVTSHLAMAEEIAAPKSPNEQFAEVTMAAMARVCELGKGDNAVITLSGKAHGACDGTEKFQPTLIKKGTRFTVARTGSEFNTLIANLELFERAAQSSN